MITNKNAKLSSLLLACCVTLASVPASAALLEVDFITGSGDGLLTRDAATGFEWLDLTETVGLSRDNIVLEGAGGWLAQGFRYASSVEVGTLFTNAGITQTLPEWTVTGEAAVVSSLLQQIGITQTWEGGREMAFGITATEASPGHHFSSCLGVRGDGMTSAVVECHQPADMSILVGNRGYSVGHHLVREATVVPLPTAFLLFGSGLIGMLPLMRRGERAANSTD